LNAQAIDFDRLRDWLKQAGDLALAWRDRAAVNLKDDGTPTTSADLEVEAFLLDRITDRYPSHQVMAEEGGGRLGNGEFVWVIDPIDGTRAFACGLPIWGVSVGVLRAGEPHLGAFYMPALGEMYWADAQQGAFYNGKLLPVRSPVEFDGPLAFIAVPSNAHRAYEIDFPRVRSLGSTAAHLVYVARGAAVGALTRNVNLWDLAGVLPILLKTGIALYYLSGRPFAARDLLDGRPAAEPIVAAPAPLIGRVRATLRRK